MKKSSSGDELRFVMKRALAFGYAALDRPTTKAVREARRLITRVLSLVDERLLGGELREMVTALRNVATLLTGLEQRA